VAARLSSLVRQGRLGGAGRVAVPAPRAARRSGFLLWAGEFLVPPAVQAPFRSMVGQELMPAWLNADWCAAHGVDAPPTHYKFESSPEILREHLRRAVTHS